MKKLIIILISLFSTPFVLLSDMNYGKKATIDTLYYLNNGSAGDTIDIVTKITGHTTCAGKLTFFSDGLVEAVSPSSTYQHDVSIYLDSGSVRYDTLSLILKSSGTSTMHFKVDADTIKSTFNIDSDDLFTYIEVKDSPDLSVAWWTHDYNQNYIETYPDLGSIGGDISFDVSGNVFLFKNQENSLTSMPVVMDGYVRLWFVRPEFWFKYNRYHPIDPTSTGYIEGVHYSKIDEDGNFQFNFDITTNVDLGVGWRVFVQIAKANDAVRLQSPTNHHLVPNSITSDHIMMAWNEAFGSELISNNSTQTYIINLKPNYTDGNVLRTGSLMRKFILERYGVSTIGSLPINTLVGEARLPQISVHVKPWLTNPSYGTNNLGMALPNENDLGFSHEYGHYLHHSFYAFNTSIGLPYAISEGFADFHSFAFRTWKENKYGDETPWFGNLELTITQGKDFGWYPTLKQDRFEGCSHQNHDPCAFAAYLWNLYDSYESNDYNFKDFKTMNNDDIYLGGQYIYEFLADNIGYGVNDEEDVYDAFEDAFTGDTRTLNALEDIRNYLTNTSYSMQSAQTKWSHSVVYSGGIFYIQIDVTPRTYPSHVLNDFYDKTFQSWRSHGHTLPDNFEDGWKVYKENGSNWDLIATTSSQSFLIPLDYGDYYVTSYNNAGNSLDEEEKSISPKITFQDNEVSSDRNFKVLNTDTFIKIETGQSIKVENVFISNLLGSSVESYTQSEREIIIEKNYLSKGMYFVAVSYSNGVDKFIKVLKIVNE